MLVVRILILFLFSVFLLTSCSAGGGAAFEFYVVVKPGDAARFIGAVRAIAGEDGLETAVGQARSDTGDALTAVEGRGHGLKLWVQNVTLSGREDQSLCGVHPEPYSDPGQFVVFTEPRFFGSRAAAMELGKRVFSQIRKSGFDARQNPAVCSAAVFHSPS